jgi:hypothetical protein
MNWLSIMNRYFVIASAVFAFVCCNHKAAQNSGPSAFEEFAGLQREAQTANKAGDGLRGLRAATKMRRLLHDAPDAVEFTAQEYWATKDTQNTLRMLRLFADLGQTDT